MGSGAWQSSRLADKLAELGGKKATGTKLRAQSYGVRLDEAEHRRLRLHAALRQDLAFSAPSLVAEILAAWLKANPLQKQLEELAVDEAAFTALLESPEEDAEEEPADEPEDDDGGACPECEGVAVHAKRCSRKEAA